MRIDMVKKNLEQQEKPELIAIIQHMLRQEPELQWLLTTPLPTASTRKTSVDPKVYLEQVLAAMSAGDYRRKPKRGEVQRRLTAIKTIADERRTAGHRRVGTGVPRSQSGLLGIRTPAPASARTAWQRCGDCSHRRRR